MSRANTCRRSYESILHVYLIIDESRGHKLIPNLLDVTRTITVITDVKIPNANKTSAIDNLFIFKQILNGILTIAEIAILYLQQIYLAESPKTLTQNTVRKALITHTRPRGGGGDPARRRFVFFAPSLTVAGTGPSLAANLS